MNVTYTSPLDWPISWPRASHQTWSRFARDMGVVWARDELVAEVRRLGGTDLQVSTNMRLTRSGILDGSAPMPNDAGVAVYFRLKGEPRVLACDKWNRVAHNLYAIAKHIDAIRGQVRWGVGSLEQAFGGYRALPAVAAPKKWWEVLGVAAHAPTAEVERKRIELLERCHPDRGGGSIGEAQEINVAWDEFRRERGLAS